MQVVTYIICLILLLFTVELPAFTATPSVAQLQTGCVRHGGINSVSNGTGFNKAAIVCKDGKLWFAKS